MTASITLTPGQVPLATWRTVLHGAKPTLDPTCRPGIEASANAVAAILAGGKAVHGINTGFGRLAALQRNNVLSHAAGLGDPMPPPVVRLTLALKLASLAQGASGVQPGTVAMLERLLDIDMLPVVPSDNRGVVDLHRRPGRCAGHLRNVRRDGPPPL